MNKEQRKYAVAMLIIMIIVTVVGYLLGTFIHLTFDITLWSVVTRSSLGTVWLIIFFIFLVFLDL
jgi:hypothetical protein